MDMSRSRTYTHHLHRQINTSKADATAGASVDPKVTFDLTVYPVVNMQSPPLTERGQITEVTAEPVVIEEINSDDFLYQVSKRVLWLFLGSLASILAEHQTLLSSSPARSEKTDKMQ